MHQQLVLTQRMTMRPSAMVVQAAQQLAMTPDELAAQVGHQLANNPALEPVSTRTWPTATVGAGRSAPMAVGFADDGTQRLAGKTAASDELESALRASLPTRDHPIAAALVGAIDHRGYLAASDTEVAQWAGASADRVRAVRALLRQLAPAGVGARDARDCLLMQLRDLRDVPPPTRRVARDLIADHLADLAAGRLGVIQAALEVSREEIVQARDLIRSRLHPFPRWDQEEPARDAGPDALVVRDSTAEFGLRVEILEAERLGVQVDLHYASLTHRRATDEIASNVASAQAYVASLRNRWVTLQRVVEAVVHRQAAFVLGGPAELLPLTQAQVARELDLAESTVSRALHGRRIQLPDGRTVPFTVFFDAALSMRAALAALVEAEPQPMPDSALAEALGEQGFTVSRRVVAKHRERLGIPAAALR